mgnify:CR=1 FL=1
MPGKTERARLARQLVLNEYQGVLSTHSEDVPGFPFGSVVPYCFDKKGRIIIRISDLAQHTKNIKANPRVSLIASEGGLEDAQAGGRATLIGVAKLHDETGDSVERYYNFFPQARSSNNTHDFNFYAVELHRVRFIGGFGKIHWVEAEDFLKNSPFDFANEARIVSHMNEDHQNAIRHFCDLYDIRHASTDEVMMVGVDAEGFNLRVNKGIHRISFENLVNNGNEVREVLVQLARTEIAA